MQSGSLRRAGLAWIGLLLVAALVVAPSHPPGAEAASRDKEKAMHRIINRTRARHGLPALRMWAKLRDAAHRHSARMASHRRVFHSSCLSCVSPDPSWKSMGENVARGRRLRAIHWKFMRSAAHRANILCRCFTRVGVGVVRRGGTLYVTEIFWG